MPRPGAPPIRYRLICPQHLITSLDEATAQKDTALGHAVDADGKPAVAGEIVVVATVEAASGVELPAQQFAGPVKADLDRSHADPEGLGNFGVPVPLQFGERERCPVFSGRRSMNSRMQSFISRRTARVSLDGEGSSSAATASPDSGAGASGPRSRSMAALVAMR